MRDAGPKKKREGGGEGNPNIENLVGTGFEGALVRKYKKVREKDIVAFSILYVPLVSTIGGKRCSFAVLKIISLQVKTISLAMSIVDGSLAAPVGRSIKILPMLILCAYFFSIFFFVDKTIFFSFIHFFHLRLPVFFSYAIACL